MTFPINFQEPDTKSLLDLVNHTNPETIGELLTYDKVDIRDFRFGTEHRVDNSDYVAQYDGIMYVAGSLQELSGKIGVPLSKLNEIYSNNNYVEKLESSHVVFNSYSKAPVADIDWAWDNGYISPVTDDYTIMHNIYKGGLSSSNPAGPLSADILIDTTNGTDDVNLQFLVSQYYLQPLCTISQVGGRLTLQFKVIQRKLFGNGTFTQSQNLPIDDMVGDDGVLNANVYLTISTRSTIVQITDKNTGRRESINFSLRNGKVSQANSGGMRFGHNGNPSVKLKPTSFVDEISVQRWSTQRSDDFSVSAIIMSAKWLSYNNIDPSPAVLLDGAGSKLAFNKVTLVNRLYEKDTVDVSFERIALADLVELSTEDFPWYDSDEWDQARDIPLAISTLTNKLTSNGINVDGNIRSLQVERYRDGEHWYLKYTFDSLVFTDGDSAVFKLPHQFSDIVTVKALNGFIYSPIVVSEV